MKKITLLFILLINCSILFGQQEAMFSQYMFNGMILNPAYAGSSEVLNATAIYRKQWWGINGAPETFAFSLDLPLASRKVGFGINLNNDKVGILNNFTGNGVYSYRILLPKGALSMGIQAGVSQLNANFMETLFSEDDLYDPAFATNINQLMFNFGTGIYYYSTKFYAGLSSPHLVRNNFKSGFEEQNMKKNPHLFFTTGYVISVSEVFKIKPSTLIILTEGLPLQYDINTNFWFYDIAGIGFSYRSGEAIVSLLEFQASKQLRFGYSYDYPLSNIRLFTSGSHEFMLRYYLNLKNTKIQNPRYF
jgi:type IX secretion system PorP/SprF family membrane protein